MLWKIDLNSLHLSSLAIGSSPVRSENSGLPMAKLDRMKTQTLDDLFRALVWQLQIRRY